MASLALRGAISGLPIYRSREWHLLGEGVETNGGVSVYCPCLLPLFTELVILGGGVVRSLVGLPVALAHIVTVVVRRGG